MSVPSHFKLQPLFFKRQPVLRKALWTVAIFVQVAMTGFLGFIMSSTIERPPAGQLVDVSLQLEEARASGLADFAASDLEEASTALGMALRAIEVERRKPWRLQSYDRARSLVERADRLLTGAEARFNRESAN